MILLLMVACVRLAHIVVEQPVSSLMDRLYLMEDLRDNMRSILGWSAQSLSES